MAIYTDIATWVGPTGNEVPHGMGDAVGMVLHIQEGGEAGTEAWQKNPASQVSSHFLAPKVGRLRQMVDTLDRAWCEVAGNSHWWSIEIEGYSGDSLTPDQVESCAQVLARAHRDEGVRLAVCDNPWAASDAEGGLGYHAMGGTAWGGHLDCPGDPIVAARPAIVARAQQISSPTPAAQNGEPNMISDTLDAGFGIDENNNYIDPVDHANVTSVSFIRVESGAYAGGYLTLAGSDTALIRIGIHNASGPWAWQDVSPVFAAGGTTPIGLPKGTDGLKLARKRRTPTDTADSGYVRWTVCFTPA